MSQRTRRVAFVIPAFEEEARIGVILTVLQELPEEYRPSKESLWVVDDCSRDNTGKVAAEHGASVIRAGRNCGKGTSMATGFDQVSPHHECICFLDADLTHITKEHILSLIEPVASGEVEATMGVFSHGRRTTTWAQQVAPELSGQRCVTTELLSHVNHGDWDCRFGIEMVLNTILEAFRVPVKVVLWEGASHVMKEEKRGWLYGFFIARLGMYKDILVTWRHKRELIARYSAKATLRGVPSTAMGVTVAE